MAALRARPKTFRRTFQKRTKELLDLSRGLPERPSSSDIHDLRVTARRLQVMSKLLPKDIRRSEPAKHFELSLKSVLRATSQLRDLDTLLDTLEQHRSALPEEAFDRLENQRSDAAAQAKVASSVLSDVPLLNIEEYGFGGKKLTRRLTKDVRRHGRKASALIPTVILDESKVAELHSLRKEVKKLRYLCELADETPRELPVLTKWQDSLGAVHDIDVALEFVRGLSMDFKGKAILRLEQSRRQSYARFVKEYRVDSVGLHGKNRVLTMAPVPVS